MVSLFNSKKIVCRYTSGRLPMHHQRMWASSLAVIPQTLSLPPALFKKGEEGRKKKKKEVLHFTSIQMLHTHPAEPGKP